MILGAPEAEIVSRARSLQTGLTANRYLVMMIDPDRNATHVEELRSTESVILRLVKNSGGTVYMCQIQGRFALLVMGDDDIDVEERTYGLAQSAMYDIEQNTSLKPRVVIGTIVQALDQVGKSYLDACSLLTAIQNVNQKENIRRIVGMLDIEPAESLSLMNLKMPKLTSVSAMQAGMILMRFSMIVWRRWGNRR